MSEEAVLHRHLIISIKQEKERQLKEEQHWKIPDEIASLDKASTLKKLSPFWREYRDKDKVYIDGTISKLLPSGRDDFIEDKTGKAYYFNFNAAKCNRNKLVMGTKVLFVIGERLDKKKNVWKKNAVEVKLG